MRIGITLALFTALLAPLARAQAPCYGENDTPNYNSAVSMGGVMVGIRFTPNVTFTATAIEVFTGNASATHSVGLWSHDSVGDKPAANLGTGTWPVTSPPAWQGATLSSAVPVTAGQTYWLVWAPTGGGQASVDMPMGSPGQPYRPSFDGGQTWGSMFQFPDRHWKFRIYGSCVSAPSVYCTSGTTSSGCAALISASGQPSVSGASACQIQITEVEGQKTGIIFYGLDAQPLPWCNSGGTSFLCVKPPTMRTAPQSSGGTAGMCDGSLSLDWNAFQAATPGALGAPWSSGSEAYVQGWFRDPPACKTTSLSNAVELTYVP